MYNTRSRVFSVEVRVKGKMLLAMTALAMVGAHGAVSGAQAPAQVQVPPPAAKIQAGDAPGYAFDITKAEIDYVR